jgi:transposase, IS5 family
MKYFKAQCSFDFEQAIWDREPELLIMDQVLDQNLQIIVLAAPCFPKAYGETKAKVGRDGMTLEQVVRAAIYQRHKRLNYRQLSDHTGDSKKCRSFMKMAHQKLFSHQALQDNISKIDSETLAKIHLGIAQYAIKLGVDDGKKLRTDSTTIKTNIHFPTNAALLWDCIRVSYRLLKQSKELLPDFNFRSYHKFGKKLLFKIVNTKGKEKRRPLFKKMLQANRRCERLVEQAKEQLSALSYQDALKEKERLDLFQQFIDLLPKMQTVTDIAYRREILDEQVPVEDKIFSIFEDHTDCIKKGGREVIFGHKINFSSGKSNLIFDCIQERGNPADTSYLPKTLDNMKTNYKITPRDVAFDGGYASKNNLDDAKERGIINIVFNKVKGSMQNSASSKKMETMLKKWRSGMEAIISNFKRGLNASMCPWKGWEAFKCFVLWSLITFNMRVIAKWIIDKLS